MSLWSWLFRRKGAEPPKNRGYTADNPLLSSSPADEREILSSFLCPNGHPFSFRRLGSFEGRCPDPPRHESPFGDDSCIVDKYSLQCAQGEHSCTIFFDMYHPNRPTPAAPMGLRAAAPKKEPGARSITLHFEGDTPAWRLKTVQPARFQGVAYAVQLRLFLLPEGALLGMLLNLYDVPNQPYFIHRVMDLSDPQVSRYAEACADHGRMIAVFESRGQDEGFSRELVLDAAEWRRLAELGKRHNASISVDGDKALDVFLEVFQRVSRERGIEPAWDEVERRCIHPPR